MSEVRTAELSVTRLPEVSHTDTIIHGDCLDVMREMPDDSIDLVFADPPYGKSADKGTNGFGDTSNRRYTDGWDGERLAMDYFCEMFRVSKNQIIFGANYYLDYLPPTNCFIVWDKIAGYDFQNPFADVELLWSSFNRVAKKYEYVQQGFIRKDKDARTHPTQKPVGLICLILNDFSTEGGLILDPFIGSGTTAIAAIRTGRHYIGIEKEQKYIDIANERIEIENAQLKLDIFDNAAGG